MVKVIAWPPVDLTGWELRKHHPTSTSANVFGGPDRTSSAGRARYLATATIPGIGTDLAGAGWVEMLVDQMQGRSNLVRVPSLAPLWYLHEAARESLEAFVQWRDGSAPLYWTDGGADVTWLTRDQRGTPTTQSGWPALNVTDLPAHVVIRPSEFITVTDSSGNVEERRVLTLVKANGDGTATIRVDEAFTISGIVTIGGLRDLVFQALDIPRQVQPLDGSWSFTWNFRQVFEEEFAGGFEDVDPWR